MADLAEADVASGRWVEGRRRLGRRFTDPSSVAAEDGALDPRRLTDGDWSPDTAAVMVLALAGGARRPPEPVTDPALSPTGPLRWICEAVTAHLDVAHWRNQLAPGTGAAPC